MVLSSKLGTHQSRLANLKLGAITTPQAGTGVSNIFSPNQSLSTQRSANRIVTSVLSFIQSASAAKIYARSISHSIIFVPINSVLNIHTVHNTLTFTQAAVAQSYTGVVQSLSFTQSLSSQYNPHIDSHQHILSFTQSPTTSVVRPKSITHLLNFISTASGVKVRFFTTSNSVILQQLLVETKLIFTHNTLNFNHSVSVHKICNRSIITPLSFDDTVIKNSIFIRSLSNSLHFVGGQKRQLNIAYPEYYSVPVAIATKTNDVVTLQSAGQVIVLLAPEMGDELSSVDTMNLRRTMNGSIYTYVKRTGLSKLSYKFIMDRPKAYELRVFIQNNLSLQQTLTNWKGEIWVGYISNNPFNFNNIPGYGPCGDLYEAMIEFEATRIH